MGQLNPNRAGLMQRRSFRRLAQFVVLTMVVWGLVLIGFDRTPALAEQPRHYTELEFPPLPELQIPDYEQFELANGLTVYLMEDHELPLVGGTFLVHTGDRLDPPDKVGLATIVGGVMRSGGSDRFPADELNAFLEQRAASIESGISLTYGSARFNALIEDLPTVFERFTDVVRNPAFPPDKIDLLKQQLRGVIARRNDNPDAIANREFDKLIYGESSPYARTMEYQTLDNITREDVLAFHQRYFHPNNMLLGLVGDFDAAEMRSLVEATLGDWTAGPDLEPTEALPPVTQAKEGGVYVVDKPQLTQSSVMIGHLGGTADSPDYAALTVMNRVLNGLGGRLLNEVRSRQGLAYSAYAVWSAPYDYPGMFIAGGQTRSETTVPFVEATLSEIEKIRREPITADELAQAQDSVINSFVFNFQSPGQTLVRVLNYDFFDYPKDFIFQYRHAVEATTAESVQKAAETHLDPEKLVTLIVGNTTEIQPPLTVLDAGDTVIPLDVTIPSP